MAEWNRDTPWRQGHLLGKDAIADISLLHPTGLDDTVVIVASHDCDLTQNPQLEPVVEVIIGQVVARPDGNFTHAKNPRKLHLEVTGACGFWGEFVAKDKVHADKLALNRFGPRPDVKLTAESHAIFQMWLASRYRRSAFSDQFERRLTCKEHKLDERITRAVKPHGDLIAGVFFDVDDGEEICRRGPNDTYVLDIIILHRADPNFEAAEAAAAAAATAIEQAFKQKLFEPTGCWQHIELRSCEAISESVLTYQQFKMLKRWRLEYVSLAADPQQPVLAA